MRKGKPRRCDRPPDARPPRVSTCAQSASWALPTRRLSATAAARSGSRSRTGDRARFQRGASPRPAARHLRNAAAQAWPRSAVQLRPEAEDVPHLVVATQQEIRPHERIKDRGRPPGPARQGFPARCAASAPDRDLFPRIVSCSIQRATASISLGYRRQRSWSAPVQPVVRPLRFRARSISASSAHLEAALAQCRAIRSTERRKQILLPPRFKACLVTKAGSTSVDADRGEGLVAVLPDDFSTLPGSLLEFAVRRTTISCATVAYSAVWVRTRRLPGRRCRFPSCPCSLT